MSIKRLAASGFSLSSFDEEESAREYASRAGFLEFIDEGVDEELSPHEHAIEGVLEPYAPVICDLARLHWLAVSRRSPCVLEFGSGYSTLVLAHAMRMLDGSTGPADRLLFRQDPIFTVHSIDEDQRFADIAVGRIPEELRRHASVTQSDVVMTTFSGRICTSYKLIPDVSPTLIYLDGPSQFASAGTINGYSTRRSDGFPMSADLLSIEHFLGPGTLIVIDGRAANARFLRVNLQRDWAYMHLVSEGLRTDLHLLELQEPALGSLNQRQLEFCLPNGFLLDKH